MTDLASINAFTAVGDLGGFRAAARALGMTPAGVSKAVARLETQLGVMLVARTTRSVRLTAAGTAYHARCKTILADLEAAGHEAAETIALSQGRLVISMTRAFGRLRILPVIADYVRQHPQVEVTVRLTDRFADLVTEGVDLAIRVGDLPDSTIVATRIGRTRFITCASPDYLGAHGTPTHPDDLHDHRVIGYAAPGTGARFTHRFLIAGEPKAYAFASPLIMDDAHALVDAALRSVGLVMANDYMMEQQIAAGSLVRVLQEFECPSIPISVLQLPTRNPSPAARAFIAMLRRRLLQATDGADGI